MARKDARAKKPRPNKWKLRLSMLLGTVLVIGGCLVIRQFWGAASVSAEPPYSPTIRRSAPPQPGGVSRVGAPQPSVRSDAPMATGQMPTIGLVAVVNGEEIKRQELANEAMRRYGEEVLESMVNKQLILNVCQQRGIVITEQDVNNEITRFAQKFNHTTDQWLELLSRDRDITPSQYARDIIWPTLALRALVSDDINITDDEINKVLESEIGPKVRVRIIAVREANKAQQLHKLANDNPDDFGRLAKEHSEDVKSASARGLIPPIRLHAGDAKIEEVAFGLREGEISEIIKLGDNHIFLRCVKQIEGTHLAPEFREAAKGRIVEHLRQKKMEVVADGLFEKLQKEVQIINMYQRPDLQRQMPGVAATIDGTPITIRQLAEECISRHGQDVLVGEVNRKLLIQQLRRANKTVNDQMIQSEVARAAESYGYFKEDGKTPDVEGWLQKVTAEDEGTVDLYVRDAVWPSVALKQLVGDKIEVTEEDIQKGFQANYGPRVEVMAIVVDDQRLAQRVWEHAKKDNSEEAFGKLAYQYSIEPVSRNNYGRVPPIQKHGGRPKMEEEAFSLAPGETSGLIFIGDKIIILRCLGLTQPVVTDLETVRSELVADLHEKKLRLAMAQEFDRLKISAQIDNFLAGTTQAGKQTAPPRTADGRSRARVPFIQTSTGGNSLRTPQRR